MMSKLLNKYIDDAMTHMRALDGGDAFSKILMRAIIFPHVSRQEAYNELIYERLHAVLRLSPISYGLGRADFCRV